MNYTVFHSYATKRNVEAPSVIKAALAYAKAYLSGSWQGNCNIVVRTSEKDYSFLWKREEKELIIR